MSEDNQASASLEDALDGLVAASRYAESIGEDELSVDLGVIYQELARRSPDEHWDSVDVENAEEIEDLLR